MSQTTQTKFDLLFLVFATASFAIIMANMTGETTASNVGGCIFTLISAGFFYCYLWLEFEES